MSLVETYIANFSDPVKKRLLEILDSIRENCPECEEIISYKMPTIKYRGITIVHFAAYDHHIGIYALPNAHKSFEAQLSKYRRGKGSFQIPHEEKLPLQLISDIVKYNLVEAKNKLNF